MEEILGTSKLTKSHQVTVLKIVREVLGLKIGDLVAFTKKEGDIVIKKAEIKLMSDVETEANAKDLSCSNVLKEEKWCEN